ncbi:MAG TPA: ECF-type sigma factor, partial [Acidobacteriota bacterium]|nr:ECF-type sigma factor [Acidobacteriota bacterium]
LDLAVPQPDINLIVLDDALNELSELDPRQAKLVELRYFGGLSVEETAEVLQLSVATVMREWKITKMWLYRKLGG